MFEWINGNTFNAVVTLYPNNITLNTSASVYFKDCRYCRIGINKDTLKMAIEPLDKETLDLNIVPLEQLHKVSIGKGYARISNKNFLKELKEMLNVDIEGVKFAATYDKKDDMLIVDLSERI